MVSKKTIFEFETWNAKVYTTTKITAAGSGFHFHVIEIQTGATVFFSKLLSSHDRPRLPCRPTLSQELALS